MTCGPTPQQAAEKNAELSAAARPPKAQAQRPSWRLEKYVQALMPSSNSMIGAKKFEKPAGPSSQIRPWVRLGLEEPPLVPMVFKSYQTPVKPAGSWTAF